MTRGGIRGGTTASREEGAVVQELHKRRVVETVDAAIWDVLAREGQVHADDLVDLAIPDTSVNVIGNRVNVFARRGWTVAIGWRRAYNPASHGRQSRVWQLTSKGRVELERQVGVGVGSGNKTHNVAGLAASHPGSGNGPDQVPLRPGGGDTNSQAVAAPDDLQLGLDLPHADTPQAGQRHFDDWDLEAA